MCEANSFYDGGQPGASDMFASALWALDFMWAMASGGASGVNMQNGFNHLDFVSFYSPIPNDLNGTVSVASEYYGMLAFAQGGRGERVDLDFDAGGLNLTAYAAVDDRGELAVTLINKDQTAGADVTIATDRASRKATALRLKGHALDSADNVTFCGSTVTADGHWQPENVEALNVAGGVCRRSTSTLGFAKSIATCSFGNVATMSRGVS